MLEVSSCRDATFQESPAVAQISSWVWLKTLQQCGKGPLRFPEPLFQLDWVSLARGTLQKQGSGGAGGRRQEHPAVPPLGKAFLAGGSEKDKREGDFRVPPNEHNLDHPRPIAEMSRGANGVCETWRSNGDSLQGAELR